MSFAEIEKNQKTKLTTQMVQITMGDDFIIDIRGTNDGLYTIDVYSNKESPINTRNHAIRHDPEMTFQNIFDYICTNISPFNTYGDDYELKFDLTWHDHEENIYITSEDFMNCTMNFIPLSQGNIRLKKKKECGSCGVSLQHFTHPHRCGECKAVYYCNESCQSLAWNAHKNFCYPTT